jgi:hypothetical protein
MLPFDTIQRFDAFLAARNGTLDAVVVGGSALVLLGVIDRPTKDVDVMHPHLPQSVADAARAFAAAERQRGSALADDWLNNGPQSLATILPGGWQERVQPAFSGQSLNLTTLGRADFLKTKLFALCDRGTDILDCVALAPSATELDEALQWVSEQDAYPLWPQHVRVTLADLRGRLGHGV